MLWIIFYTLVILIYVIDARSDFRASVKLPLTKNSFLPYVFCSCYQYSENRSLFLQLKGNNANEHAPCAQSNF